MEARVSLPGSKSLTNRALVLAALADGPSVVRRALRSRDTELMAVALRTLGATVDTTGEDWLVSPGPLHGGRVDCGLAGTVMRFVPPVAALAQGPVEFDGDVHARTRPMDPVLQALRVLGAEVEDAGTGTLPFTVRGAGHLPGGTVVLDASASSQFVSGLLLAGARYDAGVDVRHDGPPMPSLPHVDMTVACLRDHGVEVDDDEPDRWQVAPGAVTATDVTIEPDLSNAAPFLMLALTSKGRVQVPGWPRQDHAGRGRPARHPRADGSGGDSRRGRPDGRRHGRGVGHRRRPARRRRARASGGGAGRAGGVAARTCAASPTSGATRPTA